MTEPSLSVIDLTPWFSGDEAARARVAAEVDAALQSVGFFLITGHGVPGELSARVRAEARGFFALPRETKQRYAVTVGGRGWLPPGVEANAYAEGTETPPDLKESFAVGADQPTGEAEVDGYWFQPNVYPAEAPALEPAVVAYLARMRGLADELLLICAAALVLQQHFVMYEPSSPVVAAAGAGLVGAPVAGPGEGMAERAGCGAGQVCQETADLGWCEGGQAGCAFGLVAAVTAR